MRNATRPFSHPGRTTSTVWRTKSAMTRMTKTGYNVCHTAPKCTTATPGPKIQNWCLRPTSHQTPKIVPKTRAATDSVIEVLGSRLVSLGRVRGSHLEKKPNLTWTTSRITKTNVTQAKTERAAKGY